MSATKKGTATAAQVLSGYTFTNASSVGATGTMTNRGAWTNTPTGSGKVTIPAGYHNGSGYVNTATCYTNGYNAGKTSGSFSQTLIFNLRGDQQESVTFNVPVKVTCSGSMYNGKYCTATITLGNVHTFTTPGGKYITTEISGTYNLPANSTITLKTNFGSDQTWDSAWDNGNNFSSILTNIKFVIVSL